MERIYFCKTLKKRYNYFNDCGSIVSNILLQSHLDWFPFGFLYIFFLYIVICNKVSFIVIFCEKKSVFGKRFKCTFKHLRKWSQFSFGPFPIVYIYFKSEELIIIMNSTCSFLREMIVRINYFITFIYTPTWLHIVLYTLWIEWYNLY